MIVAATWDAGGLGRSSREVLGAARDLAASLGGEVALAALGEDAASVAEEAGGYGAARAFAVQGNGSGCGGEASITALAELAGELEARAVLLAADERGAEVGPRLAERVAGTAVTHALAVAATDGRLVWTRPVFGGKALTAVVASSEPVVATLRRGAFEPAQPTGGSVAVETRPAPVPDGAVELAALEQTAADAGLDGATVVVSGGAGLGSSEMFAELEELAGLLDGAVGASLAAVDAGWAAPERQVGLTGKVVSPDLYFAIGISGASQHLAGIAGAKAVVAVNTDPEAPIFAAARLGIVMDCKKFLPALIDELRRREQ